MTSLLMFNGVYGSPVMMALWDVLQNNCSVIVVKIFEKHLWQIFFSKVVGLKQQATILLIQNLMPKYT